MSTATYAVRRNQNLYRQKSKVSLGPVSVGFVSILAVSVLALLYLTQITKTSVFGYRLSELSQKQHQLTIAKQELEVEAARLQSVQQIQGAATVSKMVPESGAIYASR